MGFIANVKAKIAEKVEQGKRERLQERAAEAEIRQKVIAAKFRARQENAIKYAEAKEKAYYDRKTEGLKPRTYNAPAYTMFGGASNPSTQNMPTRKMSKKQKRQAKKLRRQPIAANQFNAGTGALGNTFFGGGQFSKKGRYNALTGRWE